MEGAFVINKYVTGKNHIGRQAELQAFKNLVAQGENIAIYEIPRSGKRSFVQTAFLQFRTEGKHFTVVDYSLLTSRGIQEFVRSFGSAVMDAFGKSRADHASNAALYLEGTHFVFDPARFESRGEILSLNWDIDDDDIKAVFRLPYLMAQGNSQKTVVLLDEFQNVMLTEDGDKICRIMYDVISEASPEERKCVSFVMMGSQYNAMKDIFSVRKLFYRQVNVLPLGSVDTRDIIDYAVRGFLSSGKVVDRDLMLGACKLFRNHIGYINELCFICDSLSKGYIMEPILVESLESLIHIHEPRFISTMCDLTTFQVSLLRAVVDGHTKFSSSEVIRGYALNSSANVRRLKDALCKKEVLTFDDNDNPQILDPLFDYWLRKYYFKVDVD